MTSTARPPQYTQGTPVSGGPGRRELLRNRGDVQPHYTGTIVFFALVFCVAIGAMIVWGHVPFAAVWIGVAAILALLVGALVSALTKRSR